MPNKSGRTSVSIRDIADACQLSVSAVSKALNGYPDISAATRKQVEETATKLGYCPNSHARALKTRRSYNLGVMFVDDNESGLTHSHFSFVLEHFKRQAEKMGYDVTFISHDIGASRRTYLEHCRYREVDGVCIACIDFSDPEVRAVVDSTLPVVTIDHLYNNRVCIQSDNVGGMRMLVGYAIGRGHKDIAYIHGPKSMVTDSRLGSFYRTMREHALPVPEAYLVESAYTDPEQAYAATKKLLALKKPPTCILVLDDYACLGAVEAVSDAGLALGTDVSLAGYDGVRFMRYIKPRLTTVSQDTRMIGGEAAKKLVGLIEDPKLTVPEIVTVPCRLIEGETVGRRS